MWQTKFFKTYDEAKRWIEDHQHLYLCYLMSVNNEWVIDYKPLEEETKLTRKFINGIHGFNGEADYVGVSQHKDYIVIHACEHLPAENKFAVVFLDYAAVIALRDTLNECIDNKAVS